MKRYLFCMVIAVASVMFLSCNDFLTKVPNVSESPATFYANPDNAIKALNAVYANLNTFFTISWTHIHINDIATDDADVGGEAGGGSEAPLYNNYTYTPTEGILAGLWDSFYQTIFRANQVLDNVPNVALDATLKKRIIAEAKFLRSWIYFRMNVIWGGIPLVTKQLLPNEYYTTKRATADEVYAQIIADLEESIPNLPVEYPSTELGRATRGAATALLSKVYAQKSDWSNAEKHARQLTEAPYTYRLIPNYSDIFTEAYENGTESIFEIQQSRTETFADSQDYGTTQGVRGRGGKPYTPDKGWGFNRPSEDLELEYEPGDPRKDATILYAGERTIDGDTLGTGPSNYNGMGLERNTNNPKYMSLVNPNDPSGNDKLYIRFNQKAYEPRFKTGEPNSKKHQNIRIIRYSDVLLLLAEALNEQGKGSEALPYLNQVRRRVGLQERTETGKEQLREYIRHERRVELAMEQHRWTDLVRYEKTEPGYMVKKINDVLVARGLSRTFMQKHLLFPIPQKEITSIGNQSILWQNPNW